MNFLEQITDRRLENKRVQKTFSEKEVLEAVVSFHEHMRSVKKELLGAFYASVKELKLDPKKIKFPKIEFTHKDGPDKPAEHVEAVYSYSYARIWLDQDSLAHSFLEAQNICGISSKDFFKITIANELGNNLSFELVLLRKEGLSLDLNLPKRISR